MLVLSRRRDESIVIGDPLNPIGEITIVDIRGDKVRVGCTFPANVTVNRKEIAEQIKAEKKGAKS